MEDEFYMAICLEEAGGAFEEEEVPVGAVLVAPDGSIVSRAHNRTLRDNSPLAHAELLAIEGGCKALGNHRLVGCSLYVSKEPCVMCAGAALEARITRLVFGCYDTKRGALGSASDVNSLPSNHRLEVRGGVLEEDAAALLKKFFQLRRDTRGETERQQRTVTVLRSARDGTQGGRKSRLNGL